MFGPAGPGKGSLNRPNSARCGASCSSIPASWSGGILHPSLDLSAPLLVHRYGAVALHEHHAISARHLRVACLYQCTLRRLAIRIMFAFYPPAAGLSSGLAHQGPTAQQVLLQQQLIIA